MASKGMVRGRALTLVLWLLASAVAMAEPHFRSPPPGGTLPLSRDVLSDAERSFLAALPEIRVAMQRVGAPPFEVIGADDEVSGFQAEMLVYLSRIFGLKVRPVIY